MAFIAVGGVDWRGAQLRRAWETWCEGHDKRPPTARLVACVRAYFAWLADESARKKRPGTSVSPRTFLINEHWRNFLGDADAMLAGMPAPDPQALGWCEAMNARYPRVDLDALVRAGVGTEAARSWFGHVFVDAGPPCRYIVRKPFTASWIRENYRSQIERVALAEGWDVTGFEVVVMAAEGAAQ